MIRKARTGDFWVIDSDTHSGAWAEAAGTLAHDQSMLPLILPHIPEGGTVVDAGAYIGTHCWPYLRKVGPAGSVLAFEPAKEAFDCLRLNCPEAFCFQVALSDHIGTGRLIPAPDMNFGTCRVVDSEFHAVAGDGQVEMMTLDSLVLRRLSLLKADVEGHELRLLKGAAETIKQLRPVMVIEVNQSALEGVGTSPAELLAFIKELGYSTQNIYPRQEAAGLQWDCICLPL